MDEQMDGQTDARDSNRERLSYQGMKISNVTNSLEFWGMIIKGI